MIRISFAKNPAFLIDGEKLIPAAAPHIVIGRVDGMLAGADARVVPQKVGAGRLVRDLEDFAARLRHDLNPQEAILERFARELKGRGIDVLSLSLDDPARAGERVVSTLARSAPSLTRAIVQIADTDAFIGAIDPQWEGAIPAMFAFDAKGTLRGRLIGEASRRDLDGLVARLPKPKP